MSKVEKKREKLKERIIQLKNELYTSLVKKDSNTKEIDVPGHNRKIAETMKELNELK